MLLINVMANFGAEYDFLRVRRFLSVEFGRTLRT